MEALKVLPKEVEYWVKLDGTDIKPAVQESVKGVWNGDVDLQDGTLCKLRQQYEERRSALQLPKNEEAWQGLVASHLAALAEDVLFLKAGHKAACSTYSKSFERASEEKAKELAWQCVEYAHLLQTAQSLEASLQEVCDCVTVKPPNIKAAKFYFQRVKADIEDFLIKIFKKKRCAATHILVILVSSEKRDRKPYALPVQYLPYYSLRDQYLRDIVRSLKEEMVRQGLKVVGE